MKFEEVIPLLRAGKKFTRKSWDDEAFICLDEDDNLINSKGDSFQSYRILVISDWEEYKQEPKPIFEETIQWFSTSDKIPELDVNLYFISARKMHHGKLLIKHGEEKRYFRNFIYGDLYSLIQVDAWAYAPKGE